MPSVFLMLISFSVNLLVSFVIARFVYYPTRRNQTYLITLMTFSTLVFFVMTLLSNANLTIGVGFGLFALFSVLRYRTDTIPIREMTYVFVFMTVPIINSLLLHSGYWAQAGLANAAIVLLLFVLEQGWGFNYELSQRLVYDRLELLQPERYDDLLADVRARTGLPISRIEVMSFDLLKDSADLRGFYPAQTKTKALRGEISSVSPRAIKKEKHHA